MQYWTVYHSEVNNVFCATFQIIVFAILHQAMQSVGTSSTVPWVSDNINILLKLCQSTHDKIWYSYTGCPITQQCMINEKHDNFVLYLQQ